MVPESERSADDTHPETRGAEPDGGTARAFDDAALYSVVRTAVKDALLDVIGTVLLVGIGAVLTIAGGAAVVQASDITGVAVGVWLVALGVYIAATALELVPSVRNWF
ncbi:hypothetical protein [Halorarius halobius]|uniref:hypothetical protein n=1 Tax=Halorarius halobius TaxID=2962671 RepID=UPI0020CDE47C|nr:hypothetical protein [Halorarius halobius]